MQTKGNLLSCVTPAIVLLIPLIALDLAALVRGVDTSGNRGEQF